MDDANHPRPSHDTGDDRLITRLDDLARLTAHVAPAAGFGARVSARLDDRALQRQTTWVLVAAALVAVAGIAFWRMADARLTSALVTSVAEWEGVEP